MNILKERVARIVLFLVIMVESHMVVTILRY